MKFDKILAFGTTAVLASSLTVLSVSRTINASPQHNIKSISKTLIAQATTLISGKFVAAEAPTTGMAQIVEENGQSYLKIDSAFSTTDQAPDLQVLLDTVEQPPAKYEGAVTGRYLNLGGLQNVKGEQSYPIPEFVDVAQFKSVVVWCRTANATMGYASLANDSSASAK
jgi:hypothetical protein